MNRNKKRLIISFCCILSFAISLWIGWSRENKKNFRENFYAQYTWKIYGRDFGLVQRDINIIKGGSTSWFFESDNDKSSKVIDSLNEILFENIIDNNETKKILDSEGFDAENKIGTEDVHDNPEIINEILYSLPKSIQDDITTQFLQ